MRFFPKVLWREAIKEEEGEGACYYVSTNEIHLFIGTFTHIWRVLVHESFHWFTNMFVLDPDVFNALNDWWEKLDSFF